MIAASPARRLVLPRAMAPPRPLRADLSARRLLIDHWRAWIDTAEARLVLTNALATAGEKGSP